MKYNYFNKTPADASLTTYPVSEVFYSFQGEGIHIGRPAVFVRFQGCNLFCPWCDSKEASSPEFPVNMLLTKGQLFSKIQEFFNLSKEGTPIIVLTGGEPLLHINEVFVRDLRREFLTMIHLETNGTFPISEMCYDWVSCSPKHGAPVKIDLTLVDELKLVVSPDDEGLPLPSDVLDRFAGHIWLQPESQRREAIDICLRLAKKYPERFRVGVQLHKYYEVE